MNPQPFSLKPRRWDARLSPFWIRMTRPFRMRECRNQKLAEIRPHGLERVQAALDGGAGVLITPNHSGHADCPSLVTSLEPVGRPPYFMSSWQVFARSGRLTQLVLQFNGCFSVEREGSDLWAFKRAVGILSAEPNPLVIFPEGEVYHLNDKITPIREGTATIALTALKHTQRPICIIPCGIKYEYVTDPTPELEAAMSELEEWLHWRPETGKPLVQRIYKFAEAMLGLKEVEYTGHSGAGDLPSRIEALREYVLGALEVDCGLQARGTDLHERIKNTRRVLLERQDSAAGQPQRQAEIQRQLDDLYFVVQLFTYPGDYVAERPNITRMAETIDKFEEDVLGLPTARIRATRRVHVAFGEPIDVRSYGGSEQPRKAARPLTNAIERGIQQMLDEHMVNEGMFTGSPSEAVHR